MAIQWTCDKCSHPFFGAIWFPRGEEQWCEDCFADDLAAFEDHRDYMQRLLSEVAFEREEKKHAIHA